MKKFLMSKKGLVLLATMIVAVAAAVGAYAYFTSNGTGTGSASVGTVEDWTVTTANGLGGPLYPGSGLENKTYTVTNASQGNQLLNAVTIKIAMADGSPWTSGTCSKNDFSINGGVAGATATDTYGVDPANDYATGAGVSAVAFTVAMVDTHVNQNDCKSTTPPIYVSAS
jgi:hypothetical protein